jgi:hypothetical protein
MTPNMEGQMARREPFTWNPTEIVEVTNASGQNLLLELESGLLRLDKDRSLRLTASALQQPAVKALVDGGKITVKPYHWH